MSRRQGSRPPQKLPEAAGIDLPRKGYQPTSADLKQADDMPGMSMGELRERFMRPFKPKQG